MNAATFQEEALKLERLLYRISYSMLSNNEDCADAVQEALTKAWQGRDSLRNQRSFRVWLTKILVNTCNDMLRKRKKRNWLLLQDDTNLVSPPETEDNGMEQALGGLSPEHRAVIVLHYLEGYKVREIAQILSIPSGTVKTRLLYARTSLQKRMRQDKREEGGNKHEKA